MANKLKNMEFTSVDLVGKGANQEADIRLYKSATEQATEAEKNIFKRFLGWLRENPAEAEIEPQTHTTDEAFLIYTDALAKSIQSIHADDTLTDDQRVELLSKSFDQYNAAMDRAVEPQEKPLADTLEKNGDIIEIEEVEWLSRPSGQK